MVQTVNRVIESKLSDTKIHKSKNSTIEMSLCRDSIEELDADDLASLLQQCLEHGKTNDHGALLVGIVSKLNSLGDKGRQIVGEKLLEYDLSTSGKISVFDKYVQGVKLVDNIQSNREKSNEELLGAFREQVSLIPASDGKKQLTDGDLVSKAWAVRERLGQKRFNQLLKEENAEVDFRPIARATQDVRKATNRYCADILPNEKVAAKTAQQGRDMRVSIQELWASVKKNCKAAGGERQRVLGFILQKVTGLTNDEYNAIKANPGGSYSANYFQVSKRAQEEILRDLGMYSNELLELGNSGKLMEDLKSIDPKKTASERVKKRFVEGKKGRVPISRDYMEKIRKVIEGYSLDDGAGKSAFRKLLYGEELEPGGNNIFDTHGILVKNNEDTSVALNDETLPVVQRYLVELGLQKEGGDPTLEKIKAEMLVQLTPSSGKSEESDALQEEKEQFKRIASGEDQPTKGRTLEEMLLGSKLYQRAMKLHEGLVNIGDFPVIEFAAGNGVCHKFQPKTDESGVMYNEKTGLPVFGLVEEGKLPDGQSMRITLNDKEMTDDYLANPCYISEALFSVIKGTDDLPGTAEQELQAAWQEVKENIRGRFGETLTRVTGLSADEYNQIVDQGGRSADCFKQSELPPQEILKRLTGENGFIASHISARDVTPIGLVKDWHTDTHIPGIITHADEDLSKGIVKETTELDTKGRKYKGDYKDASGYVVADGNLILFDHMHGSFDSEEGSIKFHSLLPGVKQASGGLSIYTQGGVDYIYLDISSGHMKGSDPAAAAIAVSEALVKAGRDRSSFVIYTKKDLLAPNQDYSVGVDTYKFLTRVAGASEGNNKLSAAELTRYLSNAEIPPDKPKMTFNATYTGGEYAAQAVGRTAMEIVEEKERNSQSTGGAQSAEEPDTGGLSMRGNGR